MFQKKKYNKLCWLRIMKIFWMGIKIKILESLNSTKMNLAHARNTPLLLDTITFGSIALISRRDNVV